MTIESLPTTTNKEGYLDQMILNQMAITTIFLLDPHKSKVEQPQRQVTTFAQLIMGWPTSLKYKFYALFYSTILRMSIYFCTGFCAKQQDVHPRCCKRHRQCAQTDEDISLTFFLYYYLNNTIQFIINETETVSTDDFGVFNHTLNIPKSAYDLIATYPVYVRVSEGGVTYSDEKVLTAPYAIFAHNGVPGIYRCV